MAAKRDKKQQGDPTTEVSKDLLITELGRAGVPQLEIRKIVGCDIHRVSRIVKHINKAKTP
jgi:hypothetical protein